MRSSWRFGFLLTLEKSWLNKASEPHKCEFCGSSEDVTLEDSRTAYDTTPTNRFQKIRKRPDPNEPIWLCRECAAEHHAYWDEMWTEYYSSRF